MTRRDRLHAVGKRMRLLSRKEAANAWYALARDLEDRLSMLDVPKFRDLLSSIRLTTIETKGKQQ
jgi:hypothetical protein